MSTKEIYPLILQINSTGCHFEVKRMTTSGSTYLCLSLTNSLILITLPLLSISFLIRFEEKSDLHVHFYFQSNRMIFLSLLLPTHG